MFTYTKQNNNKYVIIVNTVFPPDLIQVKIYRCYANNVIDYFAYKEFKFSIDEYRHKLRKLLLKRIKDKTHLIKIFDAFVKCAKASLRKKYNKDLIPKNILEYLYKKIDKAMANEPCVDNYRFCRLDSPSQIKRYNKQRKEGCCGFYDTEILCPLDFKRYRIGCNYGH